MRLNKLDWVVVYSLDTVTEKHRTDKNRRW